MRTREIFRLWLPLAVSFELMMLEGPVIQGAIGRLSAPSLNLAAWGLTMSLSLLVESPVIMLLASAIALVKDRQSFFALRKFTLLLSAFCTVLTAAVAFTPLFGYIAVQLMKQPLPIVEAAQPAMQIMLLWTAAIAWRRFYQGVLVSHNRTRVVSWGTAIRLLAAIVAAVFAQKSGRFSGVQVGGIAIMAAVVIEVIATTIFAGPVVEGEVLLKHDPDKPVLTQNAIWKFHAPLAATTLLTLLANPLTATALGRLPEKGHTLAAWPVVGMLLLVIRGWGLALQEITVSQARNPESARATVKFTWIVGIVSSVATVVFVFTPLLSWYMNSVSKVPVDIQEYVRLGMIVGMALPMITALGSWARGLLVAHGRTKEVYTGMGVNLSVHTSLLVISVLCKIPGMVMAPLAMTVAALSEYVFLRVKSTRRGGDHAGAGLPASG
ncbi:MAG: hypothetical protein ABJA67_11410 [Chthonomonadales bacterium]